MTAPRILLIRFGSFGDLVLTTPTIINLKILYPNCHLTLLTKERFRSLVELFDGVDEIRTLSDEVGGLAYMASFLTEDAASYDLIVDLHGNPRSWMTRMLTYAPQKLVYPKRRLERRQIVRTKQYPESFPHTIDLYNSTVTELGGYPYCQRPLIQLDQLSANEATRGKYICIAPETAHENKAYPLADFAETAKRLHDAHGVAITWLLTKKNQALETLLGEAIPPSDSRIAIGLGWRELAATLAGAMLSISNDSGVGHLASAVGTPAAVIFGPTHPSLGFAPRGLFDHLIEAPLWCRPCSLHGKKPCFRDHRYCFDAIRPVDVATQCSVMLKQRESSAPALFIDRDGTLIEERGFLKDPEQVSLTAGAAVALRKAQSIGYKLVVVSNQSGVARGLMTLEDVERVNRRVREQLAEHGAQLDALYYCPEFIDGTLPAYSKRSYRRKPAPGMIEEAALRLQIDVRRSHVFGDKIDDCNLARTSGAAPHLVKTGYGEKSEAKLAEVSDSYFARTAVSDTLAKGIEAIIRD